MGGTPDSGLSLPLFEDNMTNKEFKNYLKSYCHDTGATMPLWGERMKLYTEFNKVKYSDQTDLECALWEFLDDNLLKKKI